MKKEQERYRVWLALCICRDLTMESWTSGGESLHCPGG